MNGTEKEPISLKEKEMGKGKGVMESADAGKKKCIKTNFFFLFLNYFSHIFCLMTKLSFMIPYFAANLCFVLFHQLGYRMFFYLTPTDLKKKNIYFDLNFEFLNTVHCTVQCTLSVQCTCRLDTYRYIYI